MKHDPGESRRRLQRLSTSAVRWTIVAAAILSLSACDYFTSADTRVERARVSMHAGKYRQALNDLQTVLDRHPDHAGARLELAELSLQLGDLQTASKELERAQSGGASNAQVVPLRYRLLIAQGHFDEILKLLDADHESPAADLAILRSQALSGLRRMDEAESSALNATQLAPSDTRAQLQLARVYVARGKVDEALTLAQGISQPADVHAHALALQGAVALSRGEQSQARDLLLKSRERGRTALSVPEQIAILASLADVQLALHDLPGASDSVAAIAVWTPQSVLVHYLRGRIALLKNDYNAAVAESQRALQLDATHVPSRLMLAAASLGKGSLEQAQGTLEQLLATNPDNVAGRKLLAQVFLAKRRPEDARRVLASLPDTALNDSQVDWLMGSALTQSGEATAGLAYLERSAAASPGNYSQQVALAAAQLAAGNQDAALATLRSLPADAAQSTRRQQLLLAATISGKTPAEARRAIESMVAPQDADAQLLAVAGAYMASAGELQRARELLLRAIARDPKAISAHMALATVLARQSDLDGAQEHLTQVVALDSKYELAYIALAELQLLRGDRAQARQWLERAVGVNPEATGARLGLARLAFAEGDPARARSLLGQA
ncbi:MAG TPA: tetratricopeptide repeat protein, partial [Povalibacter sp.]|nr:tetratricopeptide repeat protein [Povalibacter sp.]